MSDKRTYGWTDGRIGEPTAAGDSHGISIPARPATSYSMRVYRSEKRVYARTQARRTLKRMCDGFVAAPPTEDIGVLSYSFHHNNSPAYKYRRTVPFARRSATSALKGTSVQLRAPLRSDRYPLFLILRTSPVPSPPRSPSHPLTTLRHRPSLLVALLPRAFPRSWTAVKQSRSAPPPLTIRIKPFNCRIVFDGSFSPAKLLFKLVPGYVRMSAGRLLPSVSPCSITFTH